MKKERLSGGWTLVLWALAAAVITGGVMLWIELRDRHTAEDDPAELVGASLAALEDGHPVLVVAATVSTHNNSHSSGGTWTHHRIEIIDGRDGHRLARAVVDEATYCASAGQGLLWCNTNARSHANLEVRDAATLAVRVTNAQLVASAPKLAVSDPPVIDGTTHEAWLSTSDGRFWHVDPRTLSSGVADEASSHSVNLGPNTSPLRASVDLPIGGLSFQGEAPAELQVDDHRGSSRPLGPDTRFFHASFLMASSRAPLTTEAGNVVFVAHDDTGDHVGAKVVITAQGLDGRRRWSTSLQHGEIQAAWLIDNRLVIGMGAGKKSTIIAVDASDGSISWRAGT